SAASRPSALIFSSMSLGEMGSWLGSWLGAGLMGAKTNMTRRVPDRVELDAARLDTFCCASSKALSRAEDKTGRSTSRSSPGQSVAVAVHRARNAKDGPELRPTFPSRGTIDVP